MNLKEWECLGVEPKDLMLIPSQILEDFLNGEITGEQFKLLTQDCMTADQLK